MPPALFPLFLVVHVALAIALFVPSLLLPFAFRARRGSLNPESRVASCGSCWRCSLAARCGSARGSRSAASPSWRPSVSPCSQQPWLLVALAIYAVNLGLAYFIQVPRLRSLIGLRSGSDPRWPALARRQRYISYLMAGLVGTIGFLMSTKPVLW